jgi:hypothetical protein
MIGRDGSRSMPGLPGLGSISPDEAPPGKPRPDLRLPPRQRAGGGAVQVARIGPAGGRRWLCRRGKATLWRSCAGTALREPSWWAGPCDGHDRGRQALKSRKCACQSRPSGWSAPDLISKSDESCVPAILKIKSNWRKQPCKAEPRRLRCDAPRLAAGTLAVAAMINRESRNIRIAGTRRAFGS